MNHSARLGVLVTLLLSTAGQPALRAEELAPPYRAAVTKGLDWLVKMQQRDGHWEGNGGQYQGAMTALCGMAFLMEGSTIHDGKYAATVRKAVDWMMDHAQGNGLLGDIHQANQRERYMYGHGFGLLFLACVYGEEEDSERRKKLEEILDHGVQFTGKAQTSRGGWGYVANGCNTEGDDLDEGSVTITQVQALRAARNAGISVPGSIIDKAIKYLKKSTGPNGGVIYSLGMGRRDERPALTAAAVACGFSLGEYQSTMVKGWIKACRNFIRPLGAAPAAWATMNTPTTTTPRSFICSVKTATASCFRTPIPTTVSPGASTARRPSIPCSGYRARRVAGTAAPPGDTSARSTRPHFRWRCYNSIRGRCRSISAERIERG